MSTEHLTWSLVIPTYQRQAVLLRCLRCAAQQTFPPKEIIVVDASPQWQQTSTRVTQELIPTFPQIQWKYVQAHRLSSAAQRNQGIELTSAEIIFLIDDDSLMYPDCAQEVMSIYRLDKEHKVSGIMPALEVLPPDVQCASSSVSSPSIKVNNQWTIVQSYLRGKAKRLIGDDDIFIPYDFYFPKYSLPESLKTQQVHPVSMTHGARMSYRKHILDQVRFEEILERYAVNEDNDVCYRASRLGMLLQALKAKICHLQVSEGRVSRYTATVFWGLNQAVLHCLHSSDLIQFKKRFSKMLWKRLWTQTIKDILDRRWSLPSTRGIWFVLQHQGKIFSRSPEELRRWYPEFQKTLLNNEKS